LPRLLEQFLDGSLPHRPITVCVLGLLAAVVLSHLSHGEVEKAAELGWDFLKVVLYYLLLVGIVTTPERLRRFVFWLVLFAAVFAVLALLQYEGVIRFTEVYKDVTGNSVNQATGIED